MERLGWNHGSYESTFGIFAWLLWSWGNDKSADCYDHGYEKSFGLVDILLHNGRCRYLGVDRGDGGILGGN